MEKVKKLHHKYLRDILEKRENNVPIPFTLDYVKKSTGESVHVKSAILTSYHEEGGTINILINGDDKPRKVCRCLITHINGCKIFY